MTTRAAIAAVDGIFSYDDLDDASRKVAAALLGGAGDLDQARIAFQVPPSCAYAAVQRGIWRAGGVAVPLAMSHPAAELEYVIRDAGARVVIGGPPEGGRHAGGPPEAGHHAGGPPEAGHHAGGPPEGGRHAEEARALLEPLAVAAGARFLATGDALDAAPAANLPHIGAPRRAMIIYTSGTTGRPKGVVTTHANIGSQIASLVGAWGWRPSDRLLLMLPLHHVHGIVNGLGCALAVHATCEILPNFDPEAVWDRLASGEISVFTAVPTVYSRLIASWDAAPADVQRARSAGVRGVRLMMSGSAALPVQMLERWRAITGHTLLERYGMTEIGMALSNPLDGERRPGTVGQPLPGVDVRLVNESGQPVGGGVAGEVEVRGPSVFKEYWQRPDETKAAFRDGWFRTGDMAVVEAGYYRLLGRTSVDIIKTGGFKVSALEIEEVLRAHPAIAECAVVGVDDAEWGERVSAAVELRPGHQLTLDALQQWARPQLAPYKVPRALIAIPALPRNAMGKVVKPEVAGFFKSE
jgi:malonyl-CoA/methylmalonyl-CoA synthetase